MARFYGAMARGDLLTSEGRAELWREGMLADGSQTYYGLGWGTYHRWRDGRWSVGHSGGGSSWTRYFPDEDLIIIALSNMNGAREDGLVHDIATAVFQSENNIN